MEEFYETEGFVLKVKTYNIFDALIDIYSKDFGRMIIFAKSLKKQASKLRTIFDEFNKVEFSFLVKDGLNVLKTGELKKEFYIKSYLKGISYFYIANIIMKTQPIMAKDEKVFSLIEYYFNKIFFAKDNKIPKIIPYFEKNYFKAIGFLGEDSNYKNLIRKIYNTFSLFNFKKLVDPYVYRKN